jgi:hypothetical protein
MARFFEKLASGPQPPQILSDHPNPGNRERAIEAEVRTMRGADYGYQTGEFARMKSELAKVPTAPKKGAAGQGSGTAPAGPSGAWHEFRGETFSISYPGNWQAFGDSDASSITIAPREGLVNQNGNTMIGYGAMLSYFTPEGLTDLRSATEDLIHHLRIDNPRLEVSSRAPRSVRVAGASGLVTMLAGESPFGGTETDALLTVVRPQGLFYLVFIAPQKNFSELENAFQQMLDSLRFNR